MKIPFLFIRHIFCQGFPDVVPNRGEGERAERVIFIIKLARCTDEVMYNASWMADPIMGANTQHYGKGDYVTVPGVDLCEETFVFDYDDFEEARYQALRKLRELWIQVEVTE